MRLFESFIFLSASFAAVWPASAFVLLKEEYFPRSEFSAIVSQRDGSIFNTRILTAAGRDEVEAGSSEQQERRFFAALGLAAQTVLMPTEKLRLDLGTYALRSMATTDVEENSGWNKTESSSELFAKGLIRYQLDEGIRIGGGASWILRPASIETFDFSGIAGRIESKAFDFVVPEYLIQKESSAWSVGFGWRPKASVSRNFIRSAAAETESVSEDVVLEELWSAGLGTQLQGGRQLNLDVHLTGFGTVQKRDPSTGKVSDEGGRRRYEISSLWGLGDSSGERWSLGLGYQSMGYTDQSGVNPENIPLWSLVIRNDRKVSQTNARFDGLIGYGSDKQSLPDMNANYRRLLVSLQAGLVF